MSNIRPKRVSTRQYLLALAGFFALLAAGELPLRAETAPPLPTSSLPSPSSKTSVVSPPVTDEERRRETFISAREMTSDQNEGIVTATGKVEIARNGYILHADKVIYYQKTGVMHAEGHVAILSPSGEVQFADKEEVTGDMKQAFAENAGILFPDSSRMSSNTSQRYAGRWMVADKGIYTSCNVCKEDPNNPPLWQIRADQMVHDNEEHDIYYHNATIDFAGVPLLYTPYMSTPDPTVDRRQGFLAPTPGYSPAIGYFMRVPYYVDIAPDKDAVIEPTFSSVDKLQLGGEYRERFDNGKLQFDGSLTRADFIDDSNINEGERWRGHLFGSSIYEINDIWRAGTEVALTTDNTYLLRYRYSSTDELVNRAYAEGFQGRSYAVVNGYYYQDLRPGAQAVEPLVLPQASFSLLGEPGQTLGGRWSLDGGLLATSRDNQGQTLADQGPDTRRLSINGGWDRRFVSDTGFVSTLSGLLRGDAYSADNVVNATQTGVYNNVLLARQFEQANFVTGYPIGRRGDGYQQMIEPLAAFTAAPSVHIAKDQPIEDSLDVEFDETNLFSPNRFTGNDLIEGGSRVTYGIRQTITTDKNMHIDMFGGQSYSFTRDPLFPELSGLNQNFSDYVGRIDFVPVSWFSLNYGARLNESDFSPQRQDALLSVGPAIFKPSLRYISAYQTETTGIVDELKEAMVGFNSSFATYWSFSASHTQAFQPDPGPRSTSIALNYTDECFIYGITISRNDTTLVDAGNGLSVVFHFYLRNLGGIHTDTTSNVTFPTQFRQN